MSLDVLDITNYKQKGTELLGEINKVLKSYTTGIYLPMPSIIEMRQSQYDDLMKLGNLENMYHSNDRMLVTPYNVMEVIVPDRWRLTFQEHHDLDDKEFEKYEKKIEGENG